MYEELKEKIADFLFVRGGSYTRAFPFSALNEIEKESPFWEGTRQAYLEKADEFIKEVLAEYCWLKDERLQECNLAYPYSAVWHENWRPVKPLKKEE